MAREPAAPRFDAGATVYARWPLMARGLPAGTPLTVLGVLPPDGWALPSWPRYRLRVADDAPPLELDEPAVLAAPGESPEPGEPAPPAPPKRRRPPAPPPGRLF